MGALIKLKRNRVHLLKIAITLLFAVLVVLYYLNNGFNLSILHSPARTDISVENGLRQIVAEMEDDHPNFLDLAAPSGDQFLGKVDVVETCPRTRLTQPNTTEEEYANVQCKKMVPVKGSCKFAQELFLREPMKDCSHQKHYNFCELKKISLGQFRATCNQHLCNGIFSLGSLQSKNGSVTWQSYPATSELEDQIILKALATYNHKHYGFCFIRCDLKESKVVQHEADEEGHYYDYHNADYFDRSSDNMQLLLLPPQVNFTDREINDLPLRKTTEYKPINLNVIFIDSVSRAHFYRSLPKTLNKFKKLRKEVSPALKVFDFELVQGIKDRTFENLQALFEGVVDPLKKPFGIQEFPDKPLGIDNLLKPLKQSGYKTLWLEDMCWSWEWGIPKDLRVYDKSMSRSELWQKLNRALETANIDDMDVSFASCEVLQANSKNDPFHGLDTVCLNGVHHHTYIFQYLQQYQTLMNHVRVPYASFYITNVGHDDTGRRIQTIDQDLANYVDFLAGQENTLTIFLSDHGNSYGSYVESNVEGRLELYRPFLFMLVPPKVATLLGANKMKALELNQHRLLSLLDLHYTLQSLIPNFTPVVSTQNKKFQVTSLGLFEEISANRSCGSMPMYPPAICVCDGHEVRVRNDDDHALIAEFALGELNNELLRQFHKSHPQAVSGFGNCMKLVPYWFDNIRESHNYNGTNIYAIQTKLDIFIKSPNSDRNEVFLVSVETVHGEKSRMTLKSFTRLTTYSVFKTCADNQVDLSLCICDLEPENKVKYEEFRSWGTPPSVFQQSTQMSFIQEFDCLFIFFRKYEAGATFEVFNGCQQKLGVTFFLSVSNLLVSSKTPIHVLLIQGDVFFLAVIKQSIIHLPWKWKFRIDAEVMK